MRARLVAALAAALLASACQKRDTAAASNAVVDTTIGADQPAAANVIAPPTPDSPPSNMTADATPGVDLAAPVAASPESRSPASEPTSPRATSTALAAPVEESPPIPEPEPVRKMTEQQAVDLALTTGAGQEFGPAGDGGSVRVKDVHSPQDSRQCRAYSVVENGAPSNWSIACRDYDGRWRLAR